MTTDKLISGCSWSALPLSACDLCTMQHEHYIEMNHLIHKRLFPSRWISFLLGSSKHCLSGWSNTGQSSLPLPGSLDLRSSADVRTSGGPLSEEVRAYRSVCRHRPGWVINKQAGAPNMALGEWTCVILEGCCARYKWNDGSCYFSGCTQRVWKAEPGADLWCDPLSSSQFSSLQSKEKTGGPLLPCVPCLKL